MNNKLAQDYNHIKTSPIPRENSGKRDSFSSGKECCHLKKKESQSWGVYISRLWFLGCVYRILGSVFTVFKIQLLTKIIMMWRIVFWCPSGEVVVVTSAMWIYSLETLPALRGFFFSQHPPRISGPHKGLDQPLQVRCVCRKGPLTAGIWAGEEKQNAC